MSHKIGQNIFNALAQRGEVQNVEAKDWVERLSQRGEEERSYP